MKRITLMAAILIFLLTVSATAFARNGWSTPINVSKTPDTSSWMGQMVVDSQDNIHLVWTENIIPVRKEGPPKAKYELFYSYKKGMPPSCWAESRSLTKERKPLSCRGCFPHWLLTIDREDNVYLIWKECEDKAKEEHNIFFSIKTKDSDWSEPQFLIPKEIDGWWTRINPESTAIFDNENNLLVICYEGGKTMLFSKKDNGEETLFRIPCTKDIIPPWEIVSNERMCYFGVDNSNTFHYIWGHKADGGYIWLYTSKPENGTWADPIEFVAMKSLEKPKAVLDSENNLHFIYGHGFLFYIFKSKEGRLSEPLQLFERTTKDDGSSSKSLGSLAIDKNDTLHLVWDEPLLREDEREGTVQYGSRLMYAFKPKGGQWSIPMIIDEKNPVSSGTVDEVIKIGKEKIHVAYQKEIYERGRNVSWGNHEIYYTSRLIKTPIEMSEENQRIQPEDKYLTTLGFLKTAALQNFPNPFNPDTWIPFQLAEPAEVNIRIYNTQGQIIRTIFLKPQKPGLYLTKEKAAYWDGRNESGKKVASGVYFYTLQAGGFFAAKKMVILK